MNVFYDKVLLVAPHRSLGPMYFTYGIVFACGCSFAYQPSLVILGHYFKKRLPFLLSGLLEKVGLQNTMRVLCILMFVLMLAGFTYKPLLPVKSSNTSTGSHCPPMNRIFNINIWRSLGYRIWAFGIPAALYGYFVPYVHLVSFFSFLFLHLFAHIPPCLVCFAGYHHPSLWAKGQSDDE